MKLNLRILSCGICLSLLLSFAACTVTDNPQDESDTKTVESQTETKTEAINTETESSKETESETVVSNESESESETETETETETTALKDPLNFENLSDLDKLTAPFWRMNVMYNECTTFIVRSDGSITANLLFKPTKLISVKSNDLKTEYKEGVDFSWDKETNTLTWLEGSSIKYFTQNDIHGINEDGNLIDQFPSWDSLGRSRFGKALYCVGPFLYEKQIAVTYEYEYGTWDGPVTEYQGDRLVKTMEKIRNGEEVTIVFFGDSIFTGCDSSAMYNREPFQKSFPDFVKLVLEEKYTNLHVKRYNPSVGGMTSDWGVSNVSLVTEKEPDLVFIGFGMNDGGQKGTYVKRNISKIISGIKEQCPDCEFVVVAPMVPNNDSGFLSTHGQFPSALNDLAGEGVAFVDMFGFHKKILEQKDFISTSGNNINHPNDWLIRCYTMNLLSVLLEY